MNKKKPVRFQKPIKYIDDSKHGLVFRVPANETGFKFVEDFRKYLNTHNYELSTRYTGKRVPSNAGHTLKENATSIRGYVKAKKKPKTKSLFKNARFSECLVEDTDVPNVTDVSDMYYALGIKDEEMERMQKELLALNNRVAEQVQWNLELQNKLDAKENELKLEITAHTMMREERDKLKTELRYRDKLEWTDMTKDERDNPHGKTYELSVSDCECQGCPPKIGECDCRDSLPLIPEYNCHTEINKLKEERDELDKLCMSQQVEIDRLNTKVDNEVCEGNCVSHDDWDAEWIRANVLQDKLNVILGIVEIADKHRSNGCHHTPYWAIKTIAEYEGDTNA